MVVVQLPSPGMAWLLYFGRNGGHFWLRVPMTCHERRPTASGSAWLAAYELPSQLSGWLGEGDLSSGAA